MHEKIFDVRGTYVIPAQEVNIAVGGSLLVSRKRSRLSSLKSGNDPIPWLRTISLDGKRVSRRICSSVFARVLFNELVYCLSKRTRNCGGDFSVSFYSLSSALIAALINNNSRWRKLISQRRWLIKFFLSLFDAITDMLYDVDYNERN